MNSKWKKCVFVIIYFNLSFVLGHKFNTSEYYRMPPLYKFDDFDSCIGLYQNNAAYCVVNTYIKPDYKSELYQYIERVSRPEKQHYRHDKLQRGVCVNTCIFMIEKMTNSTNFYVDRFPMNTKLTFDFVRYHKIKEMRIKYDEAINKCVNFELMTKYNLKGFSSIEYCAEPDLMVPFDWLDVSFVVVVALGLLIILASSLYDRWLKNSTYTLNDLMIEDHYKIVPDSKWQSIFLAFSVRRNWHTISSETKENVRDLRFIQAVRALTLLCVIIGHCGWYSIILPSFNPIFMEDIYTMVFSMLVVNGINIVQSFFVIGGFINTVCLLSYIDQEKKMGYALLWKATIIRYVRLAPVMIFFVVLHGTWLFRLLDGPLWNKVNESERQFCRDNWWHNLLFINNYASGDEKCLVHTWYIAADFYLSFIGTYIVLVIVRKPRIQNLLIGTCITASFIITAMETYSNELEPITIFSPEALRNQLYVVSDTDKSYFSLSYAPTHLNAGNYFIGIAVGLFYQHIKKNNIDLGKSMVFRIMWYLCIVGGFTVCISAYIFYENDFQKPSIIISIISACLKHSWGVILGVGMIGIIFKYGWFIANIFNYPAFRVLGRISYSAFMSHLFLLKLFMTGIHQPLYLSVMNITAYVMCVLLISNIVGLFLCLFLEVPVSTILKVLFRPAAKKATDNNNVTKL